MLCVNNRNSMAAATAHTYHLDSYLICESYYFGEIQLSMVIIAYQDLLWVIVLMTLPQQGHVDIQTKKQPNYNDSTKVKLWQLQNQFKSFLDSHG